VTKPPDKPKSSVGGEARADPSTRAFPGWEERSQRKWSAMREINRYTYEQFSAARRTPANDRCDLPKATAIQASSNGLV